MGHRTVMEVPRVIDYGHAKIMHDNSKPIRGRAVEQRPLGERRHVDTYWVRMGGENKENVEFVLYNTPVITYKPDGEVVITTNGYCSQSTHQFVEHVIGVRACTLRGTSVFRVDGKEYSVHSSGSLTIKRDNIAGWRYVKGAEQQHSWRLNRVAANTVKGRYKKFAVYLKGMLNLRSDTYEYKYGYNTLHGVRVSLHELHQAFGVVPLRSDGRAANRHGGGLDTVVDLGEMMSTKFYEGRYKKQERHYRDGSRESLEKCLALMKDDQPEEGITERFYKASLLLVLTSNSVTLQGVGAEDTNYTANGDSIRRTFRNMMLLGHSDEAFVRVELPLGEVPRSKYDKWMDK